MVSLRVVLVDWLTIWTTALVVVAWGQVVPFLCAGTQLLQSPSMVFRSRTTLPKVVMVAASEPQMSEAAGAAASEVTGEVR